MVYNVVMISEKLKDKRIKNAETACRNARTDWAKDYWYNNPEKMYLLRDLLSFSSTKKELDDFLSRK